MSKSIESLNLDNFIRTSQYFATIKSDSDIYNETMSVLKNFFDFKTVFFALKNKDQEFEISYSLDNSFTEDKDVLAAINPFLKDVCDFGFLTTEDIEINGIRKTVVFLPISVFNKIRSILSICYDSDRQLCKDGLNILLSISTITGTFLEKQETQVALGKLENQNKTILESAGEGICGLDASGRYTFVNPAAANMLGYEAKELIGKKSHEVWHKYQIDGSSYFEEECPICKSYKSNRVYSVEDEVFLKKDGTSFPVEYVSTSILKNNTAAGAVIVFKDISERKKAENLLIKRQKEIEGLLYRERKLKELLKTIASVNDLLITSESIDMLANMSCQKLSSYEKYYLVAIFLQDVEKLYFYTENKSSLKDISKIKQQLKKDFLANKQLQTVIKDGQYKQIDNLSDLNNKTFEKIVEDLNVNSIHLLPLRKDIKSNSFGSLMVFGANHMAFEFAKEELQMLQELSGDIGFAIHSYRQKDALVELNKSIKTIIDATMEGIFVFEKDKCVDVNQEAVKLFGYDDRKEILGKKILDFVESHFKGFVGSQIEAKNFQPYETNLIKKDGSVFNALVRNIDLDLSEKNRNIFTVVDLSELKTKEQLLIQQSKMAAMGEMIANIAHQWRQPISVIAMWANNMLVDVDIGEISLDNLRKYAKNINEQTQYLSQTIEDFRNFFMPNKQKNEFTLKDIIDKTMELVGASFKTHNIEVVQQVEDVSTTSFKSELAQAILNIIKNAKDLLVTFPKERRRLIFIDVYGKDDEIFIEIKDNAGGVPQDVIDKVFEPYFTTKHKSIGTGIGLYMTESIITKHLEGRIFVENANYEYEGQEYTGAKFSVVIPR